MMTHEPPVTTANTNAKPSRFLTQLAEGAKRHGHSENAAEEIVQWTKRYILFHGKQHPQEMGRTEIGVFLNHVAKTEKDALRAIDTAHRSLAFLYSVFLQRELGELPMPRPPRLLDQVRQVMRVKHYALRTEECYTQWIKRFILFHAKRHPRDMGGRGCDAAAGVTVARGHPQESLRSSWGLGQTFLIFQPPAFIVVSLRITNLLTDSFAFAACGLALKWALLSAKPQAAKQVS